MKYFVLILLMIGFASIVSAGCEDGQIDINSASLEELEKLDGIGPVKALAIIDTRPFDSVDDLIKVYGIANKTLEKIKNQNLACVNGEEKEIDDEPDAVDEEIAEKDVDENIEESIDEIVLSLNDDFDNVKKEVEIIALNNEGAEKKDDLIYTSKNARVVDYLVYGFALFLIFIIGFLIWERF